jgi:glycosyltransferase involved in cell wall biosynthesis
LPPPTTRTSNTPQASGPVAYQAAMPDIPAPLVSLVIPAYDEERRLPATLGGWEGFLATQPYPAEVLVVDDGSRDGTAELVRRLAAERPWLKLIQLPGNRGKGAAVKVGMLQAQGAWAFYADADLNVAPRHLTPALALLSEGRCDVVVGSRRLRAYAAQERSARRLVAGGLVQLARRGLVLPVVRDTQCGFKGVSRAAGQAIFRRTRIVSFAFDIEVLFLARKLGYRIAELRVETTYRAGSTFNLERHLRPFLADIVRIRRNDLAGYYR